MNVVQRTTDLRDGKPFEPSWSTAGLNINGYGLAGVTETWAKAAALTRDPKQAKLLAPMLLDAQIDVAANAYPEMVAVPAKNDARALLEAMDTSVVRDARRILFALFEEQGFAYDGLIRSPAQMEQWLSKPRKMATFAMKSARQTAATGLR
jgi:hypothetical protein